VILALKVIAVILVVLLLVAAALRIRKLRRDETRELTKPIERRLVAPPPSPYEPSKGFRLLDGTGEPLARPAVERPRLDPDRHYVFSDTTLNTDEVVVTSRRHNNDWFLSRSSHRSTWSILLRRVLVIVLILLVIAVVVTYYVNRHSIKTPKADVHSTTTLASTTTSTPAFPSSFQPISTSSQNANYTVPATTYQAAVSGTRDATGVAYKIGPKNTLDWQGRVTKGLSESLPMTGNSYVTLGSPSNTAVSFEGSLVSFPTPLPPTLNLVFTALSSTTTSG
jgi:hypothetical protein